jgi:hypothetical protein
MFRLIFVFFLIVIASCHAPSTFTKEEQRSVTNSVREALNNYYDDINKKGLMGEISHLDSSGEFFWVPPGYTSAISYDSVIRFVKQNAPLFKTINNVWDSVRIIPLSKELATYTGKIHSTMTDTSGRTSTYFLIETGILIKRKDGWKLLNGQTALLPAQ